jgi:actin-like ATPase involved in cell morphogenesis
MALAVQCIVDAPPDLANDLVGAGLTLVGGGCHLPGLDEGLAIARCLVADFRSPAALNALKFG